jgi:Uma2 family endonuclease
MGTTAADLLTLEEFERLDDTDGLELVDGVVEETCMGMESGQLAKLLMDAVDAVARSSRAGLAVPNDQGVDLRRTGRQLLRKPDGMFIRRGRLPGNRLPTGWLEIVPDIAWEIVSPGDRVEALEKKLADYREAGFPLVWVVYPGTRTARIEHSDGRIAFIDAEGYLEGEDLLPGFRLRLGELFERYEAEVAALNEADAVEGAT